MNRSGEQKLFLEKLPDLRFYINMNTKDIVKGKFYRLDIWDDELIYVQCKGEEDGWKILETPDHAEWRCKSGVQSSVPIEVSMQEYGEHLMDLMRERGMGDRLDEIIAEAKKRQGVDDDDNEIRIVSREQE